MIKEFQLKEKIEKYKTLELQDFPRDENMKIDRREMLKILLLEEYGIVDIDILKVGYSLLSVDEKVVAGKAKTAKIKVKLKKNGKSASFPFSIYVPYNQKTKRTVINLSFDEAPFSRYSPLEELIDMGLTVVHVCYKDITSDDNDFENGVAPLLTNRQSNKSAGKIAIWAYCTTLIADFLLRENIADEKYLAIAGHSRLGKTALLAGALDERFTHVHTNCSGCSGLAISKSKSGETIEMITNMFPYWFCENYKKYAKNENSMPFDQHFLLASIAPRKVSAVIAEEDTYADSDAQYLCSEVASIAYDEKGVLGLDESKGILKFGEQTKYGSIRVSLRKGTHFFSRDDWHFFNECFR